MLFGLAQSLRSLTASPIKTAVDQAHHQARRWLQNGGTVSPRRRAASHGEPSAFAIPSDIDPIALGTAIDEKLQRGSRSGRDGGGATTVLKHGTDGRLVVPVDYVQRLGDGDDDRGKRFLDRVVGDIRARRVLMRSRQARGRKDGLPERPAGRDRLTEVLRPHSISPTSDDDLGVLAVADISVKGTLAPLPTHHRSTLPINLGNNGHRHHSGP